MSKKEGPTDRVLSQTFLEGKSESLVLLVQRYHKEFCQKAYFVVKDAEMAKDVAQESWITIIQKLHALRNLDQFKSWAFRIVYSKAIDKFNNRTREREIAAGNDVDQSSTTNAEQLNRQELALLRAIQELPKGKQDIIRLFYTEDYSIAEISKFLKVPVGTVKSRLFKAREKLKSILKSSNYEE